MSDHDSDVDVDMGPLVESDFAVRHGFVGASPDVVVDGPLVRRAREAAGLTTTDVALAMTRRGYPTDSAGIATVEDAPAQRMRPREARLLAALLDLPLAAVEARPDPWPARSADVTSLQAAGVETVVLGDDVVVRTGSGSHLGLLRCAGDASLLDARTYRMAAAALLNGAWAHLAGALLVTATPPHHALAVDALDCVTRPDRAVRFQSPGRPRAARRSGRRLRPGVRHQLVGPGAARRPAGGASLRRGRPRGPGRPRGRGPRGGRAGPTRPPAGQAGGLPGGGVLAAIARRRRAGRRARGVRRAVAPGGPRAIGPGGVVVITRVLLRNWRGYEKLSLDFGPGLTFVIADNGVGKTSLVNGVAWAIFGDESGVDGDAAIRAGTEETSAEVDVVLGDVTVSLTRTLRRQAARGRSRQTLRVAVGSEGHGGDGAALRRLLGDTAGVPLEIVPQLMFVPEMRLTHEGELFADVQEHLAALLGIDDLRRAARTLRAVQGDAARDLRALQQVARIDEAAVAALSAAADDIRSELEHLDGALVADGEQRAGLDAIARALRDWAVHDQRLARHEARLDELAAELRSVGIEPDPDEVAEAARRAGADSRDLHADLVAARTETTLVEGLVEQLQQADAACPLCLQSLDGPTAEHAAGRHRARLAELAERQADTERRRRAVDAAADKLRAIADDLARQRPPEPPESPRPDVAEPELQAQLTELDRRRAEMLDRRGALGERLTQAERALDEARRTREADAALTGTHAVAASSTALAQLAEAEADARTERALEPISQAIAARWAEFFVGSASRPRLAGGGSIELGHHDVTIPYGSFSGGEKTLASLLTRLLFVTAATGLRSMWLDEPLEHLDPANRTRVARLLAQVTQPGGHMQQMVVTTYEEGLARSMVGRHDATAVVYVSTDALL